LNQNIFYELAFSRILAGLAINWPTRDRILKEEFHPRFPMVKNDGLQICGLEHQRNLRICDLRINHIKIADLRIGTP
jgi:hypothetical protein